MQLLWLTAQGITAFPEPVTIDFRQLPPGLVAFVGRNGAGKTTLMELTGPLTLFLRSVYYDCGFIDMVRTGCREAFSELGWAMSGHEYVLRVSADDKTRKTEALLSCDGAQIAGPTLSDVRTHLDQILPGFALFLASAFSAQRNETSFFELSPSKRKEMLIDTMQLGKLQELSEAAAERAAARVAEVEGLRARVGDVEVEAARRAALEAEIATAVEALERAETMLAALQEKRDQRRASLDAIVSAINAAQAQYDAERRTYDTIAQQRLVHEETVRSAEAKRQRVKEVVAALDGKRAAAAALAEARERLAIAQAERDAAVEVAREVEARLAKARQEHALLRGKLSAINDRAVRAAKLAATVDGVDTERDICKVCPIAAAGIASKTEVRAAEVEAAEVTQAVKRAADAVQTVQAEHQKADDTVREILARMTEASTEVRKHEAAANGLAAAEAAAGQLGEIEDQLLELGFVELPELPALPQLALPDATGVRNEYEVADYQLRVGRQERDSIQEKLAGQRGQLQLLEERVANLAALTASLRLAEEDQASWRQLAKALGRDGIQALEIDAAGPLIQAMANDLLVSCYGTRFALKFVTTEPKKGKGGGVKEVFECQIIDAVAGRTVKRGSGGEQVIIDEALRLALTLYAGIKSGREQRTLWRDESVGPLDPENAAAYVAMLRRAMDLGKFERCLLIAHTQEVWEGCDAQVFVADGAVRIAA